MKKTIQTVTKEMCKNHLCDGMVGISAHGMSDQHICKGTINAGLFFFFFFAQGFCWNFGETYAAVKMTTFPRNSMSISAGQCQASFCMSYNSVAS